MHGTTSNDMCYKSFVPSILKNLSAWIPLVRKEVSNKELQVDVMGFSLLSLIFM